MLRQRKDKEAASNVEGELRSQISALLSSRAKKLTGCYKGLN